MALGAEVQGSTTAVRSLRIEIGQASHPGRDPSKQVNEDACGYAETKHGYLFVVCDGMGGHTGGRQASDIAVRTIFDVVSRSPGTTGLGELLTAAIVEAGRKVYQYGGETVSQQQRPGATCVALLLDWTNHLNVVHVGDSRAYLLRDEQIHRLTTDHSIVQDLITKGVISAEEAVGHPDANKITRALGMTAEVEVELRPEPLPLVAGDVLLLSSDGLTDLVSDNDLREITGEVVRRDGAQAASEKLVAVANERGGHDNITVQVVLVVKRTTKLEQPAVPGGVDDPEAELPQVSETVLQEPAGAAEPAAGPSGTELCEAPTIISGPATEIDAPPTFIDSGPSGLGRPIPRADPSAPGAAVSTTAPDGGGITTLDEPPHDLSPTAPDDMLVRPVITEPEGAEPTRVAGPAPGEADSTAPNKPAPTIIDPGLAEDERGPGPPAHAAQPEQAPASSGGPPSSEPQPSGRHVYALAGMAMVIAVLVILLVWALLLR